MDEKDELLYLIYDELKNLRISFELYVCVQLKDTLNDVATTDNRKAIWILLNGKLSTSEISQRLKISIRAVQQFIEELISRNLVIRIKKGFYKRRIECVPEEWYKIKRIRDLISID